MVSSVDQCYQLYGWAIDSSRVYKTPYSWAMSTNGANDSIISVTSIGN